MATLYWGGGTGTWDGFTITNWYTNAGRTVASTRAPSAEDDVIFDSASSGASYTVTIANGTTVCRSCTITGPASGTLTLAGSASWYIYGSLSFPATGFTLTYSGTIFFYATTNETINTNGVSLSNILNFSGTGTYTLSSALSTTNSVTLNAGTLNTNNQTLSIGALGQSVGTLTLGSSVVNCSGNFGASGQFTLNAGTSTINFTGTFGQLGVSGFSGATYYNVAYSSTGRGGTINGNNTFNNLTIFPTAACATYTLAGNQTINGTLSFASNSVGYIRGAIVSSVVGTPRTLTVNARTSLTDYDFRDIIVAGNSSPWSGTRLGNCGGNTNITFPAAATRYMIVNGAVNFASSTICSNTSGGTGATAYFPLAQDTIIVNDAGVTGSAGTNQVTWDGGSNNAFNIGTLDCSQLTKALTFTGPSAGNFANIHGNAILSSALTLTTGSLVYKFLGTQTQTFTTAGKTLSNVYANCAGTLQFNDAVTTTGNVFLNTGTLNLNNQDVTCQRIFINIASAIDGNAPKTLTLGSGTITTTSGIYSQAAVSNLTVNPSTGSITASGAFNLGFTGITCNLGGTWTSTNTAESQTQVFGNVTVTNLQLLAPTTSALVDKLILYGNLTVTGTLNLGGGTSITQRMFVRSDTIGTQRTLSAGSVANLIDADFRDISAAGTANWTIGTRLGNCGGNANITFPAAKNCYRVGTGNWNTLGWALTAGGAGSINNFPLAQDTAIFTGSNTVTTTLSATYNVFSIDYSGRTVSATLTLSASMNIYGDFIGKSSVAYSGTSTQNFNGTGNQGFTSAGVAIPFSITINKPSGIFRHNDAFTVTGSAGIIVTAGSYETQNYNISINAIQSSTSNIRSINFGTSTITTTGSTMVSFSNSTNLTLTANQSIITSASAGAKTFDGGGLSYGTVRVTFGSPNIWTITGANTFVTFTNTSPMYLLWSSNATQTITTFSYTGSAGNIVRWYTNIPGQRATLKTASNAIGVNSTDGGNNSGLSFTGASPNYFFVKDIAYTSPSVAATSNFFLMFN